MAQLGVKQDFCVVCRNEQIPECEISGICSLTRRKPEDEEYSMDSGPENEWVISGWEEITSISRKEKIEKVDKEKKKIYYVPTLEKLEIWVEMQDWKTALLDKQEFFRRLTIFHSFYVKFILEQ